MGGQIKSTNSFSVDQDELDFVFAQHYFPHESVTDQKVCLQYMCVQRRKRICDLFFFLFLKVYWGNPVSAFSICVVVQHFPLQKDDGCVLRTAPICWEEGDRTELFVCFL